MATMNRELNRLEIRDVFTELKAQVKLINDLTTQLGNRNLVGPKKADVIKTRREALKNCCYLTAAGIVNGLLNNDAHGFLRAECSNKHFKEPASINEVLKGILIEEAKIPSEGVKDLSLTQLARLIETPYGYEPSEDKAKQANPSSVLSSVNTDEGSVSDQVPEVDGVRVVDVVDIHGNIVVFDKDNKTLYAATTEGEHPSTTEGEVVRKTFFGKIAVWLCSIYNIVWNAVKKFCSYILAALVTVWAGAQCVFEKIKTPFVKKEEDKPVENGVGI